jgi:hypothetical protein
MPGKADCLIAMEMSELLRPGFLERQKSAIVQVSPNG